MRFRRFARMPMIRFLEYATKPNDCPRISTGSERKIPYAIMAEEPTRLMIQNPTGSSDSFLRTEYIH